MPAETYNAFVSYAWVDNEPSGAGNTRWVSTFVDRLRKQLARELGRREHGDRVWLDYERLRGSHQISPKIREQLEASHLLVPILSKGYLASPWCVQELEIFLALHGPDTGRIFPVWMSPVDDPPEALASLLKYKFWYEDEARQPRTRWFPDIDATDRAYGDMQQDMARDMAARLIELRPTEAAASAKQPPLALPIEGEHLVLVSGGQSDADQIRIVAERLGTDHGIGYVVPLVAQRDNSGYDPSELTKDLRDNLGLCTCVLMLNCLGPQKQVYQHLKEYQRSVAKRPKGKQPPSLVLCHGASEPVPFHPPGMRKLPVNGDCADDCLWAFLAELAK